MPGSLILAGGDEFRPGCEEMDSAILKATGAGPTQVLILPTAAVTGPKKAASDGVRHFSALGADASELMVLTPEHANDEGLLEPISSASVVYFTGGDPIHLLATLQGSKLLDILKGALDRGAIVGGSSAGAMVMGSLMWRYPTKGWAEGLGVGGELAVLPHHETGRPPSVLKWLSTTGISPETVVLGIDAKTCCLGNPGSWKVLGYGKVTVYHNGTWSVHESGECLPDTI